MRTFLLNIFFFFTIHLCAQQYYNDAQLRIHLSVEKRINKLFSVQLKHQSRLNQNMSNYRRASFNFGLICKLNKYIRVKGDYVLVNRKNQEGYNKIQNWYSVSFIGRYEYDKWRFIYRNKLQARFGYINSDQKNVYRLYDRNQVSVKYEFTKRYTGYVSEEIYIPLNSPQATGIDRSRTFIGVEIRLSRKQQLELYFMYQAYLQKNNWLDQKSNYSNNLLRRDYVYGISYAINF